MFVTTLAIAAILTQEPTPAPKLDLAVISARLGPCSADFTVKDADSKPVYAALIHVRIRYGFMSIKRMDLEIGTDSDGKARVEGLPNKAKPLTYDISKAGKKTTVEQDLARSCNATNEVSLK